MNTRYTIHAACLTVLLAMTGCTQSAYYAGARGSLYAGAEESFTLIEARGDYGAVVPYGDSEKVSVLFALNSAMGYSPQDRGVWLKPLGFSVIYRIAAGTNYMLVGLVAEPSGLTVLPRPALDARASPGDRVLYNMNVGLVGGIFVPVVDGEGERQGGLELRMSPHLLVQNIQDKGSPMFGLGVELGWRQLSEVRASAPRR